MSAPPGWSRGYPVGRIYPPSWHAFQSPAHLRAICALSGVRWDVDPLAPLSIGEIGCGIGYTAALLAAGTPGASVVGIDYNPAQIAEARRIAGRAELGNVRFVEADLAYMSDAAADALPEFDIVTVHGVWSWVADPVREGVLRIIRRRLRAGGVALVSYNALPGAAGALGLAKLANGVLRRSADPIDGLQAARSVAERLIDARAAHLPSSSWRRVLTGEAPGASEGYLIHEFQTDHWRPSFFEEVANALASARCDYAGSATIDENFPQMSLDPAQRAIWDEAASQAERQLLFDLCVPRAFRRDVYVRGLRPTDREASVDALLVAASTHAEGEMTLAAQTGVAALPAGQSAAIRASLRGGARSIRELRALPECAGLTAAELLAVLIGSGAAAPLWREPGVGPGWDAAAAAAQRLTQVTASEFAPHGVGRGQMGLASPALAGALSASALELSVASALLAFAGRDDDPGAVAARLLPPGEAPDRSVLAELEDAVAAVLRDRVPAWRALQII